MATHCIISFGSNLGHRDELIATAARMVADSPLVTDQYQTSRLFETPPIGGPRGQEPFLNAVAVFRTKASAREILEMLQAAEQKLGRIRRKRWDARSIDLDVVLHGELMGGGSGLIVPHPRYTARQFVLQPACDVAADFRDPRFGWTLRRLWEHVSCGVPSLALVGGDWAIRQEICQRLRYRHGIETFAGQLAESSISVVGQAPISGSQEIPAETKVAKAESAHDFPGDEPWVTGYLPKLPALDSEQTKLACVPRLVARLQRTTAQTRWPAPHQIWPGGWTWPEYRLEIDDLDWAVNEVASALDSMRCPVSPVTEDGNWWQ